MACLSKDMKRLVIKNKMKLFTEDIFTLVFVIMISNNAKLNPKSGNAEKVQQILSVKKGIKFVLHFSGTL